MKKIKEKPAEKIWSEFEQDLNLSEIQLDKFKKYSDLLIEWNKKFNLTAITNLGGIVRQHFKDSLILKNFIDLNKINSIADIGSGAGFPSIPLKIIFPNLKIYLIEVNKKKQKFLKFLIDTLKLENVEIIDLDWRTFLRKTEFEIDYFVTRAALHELELIRMFKPACFYKNSKLVYWASQNWECYPKAKKYLKKEQYYKLGKRERKLIFFEL
ncbi:16S rRNA (guanine(527)-N(7))-methyltransferase RsmG [Candidatus Dependentiae bacterium]|nr:16S rRNA (guanine(527)-N(7))-methyltransferase RsmG [Candidatus Dependentiae bacterium]